MLLWLASMLEQYYHGFAVVHYISIRAIFAALTAFCLGLWAAPPTIRMLTRYKVGQNVRNDGPQTHLSKAGTPTMGGILILFAISVSMLFWGNLLNRPVCIVMLMTLGFGAIGFCDDYRKLVLRDSKGISARTKYCLQSLLGLGVASYLFFTATTPIETQLLIPFFKHVYINLSWVFIILTYFVVVGSSNAVNLTDGLDGLAILPIVLVAIALGVFAYLTGNIKFSDYLYIPYVPGVGELVVFCAALAGAGFAFLWFNFYPAEVFMGDVGSLSLGAALGIIAVLVRQELVYLVMGGVFVAETVSVMLQVASFKMTGKRIFRMAPLHHHFELKGWPESKVIVRFWIITVILVLIGLSTLKLR